MSLVFKFQMPMEKAIGVGCVLSGTRMVTQSMKTQKRCKWCEFLGIQPTQPLKLLWSLSPTWSITTQKHFKHIRMERAAVRNQCLISLFSVSYHHSTSQKETRFLKLRGRPRDRRTPLGSCNASSRSLANLSSQNATTGRLLMDFLSIRSMEENFLVDGTYVVLIKNVNCCSISSLFLPSKVGCGFISLCPEVP